MPSSTLDERTLLLPDVTLPGVEAIARRHKPSGQYQTFRQCMRWDFGFTCCICLVHEADLAEHGVQGTGLTSIEHRQPRSSGQGVDDYDNCLYVCRYCNTSRGKRPLTDALSRSLLDPTQTAWGAHFSVSPQDSLVPHVGDNDANYTAEAYSINSPRRLKVRRNRREQLTLARGLLSRRTQIGELITQHSDLARELSETLRQAVAVVIRFRMVPADAPASCLCDASQGCTLPKGVREQGAPAV